MSFLLGDGVTLHWTTREIEERSQFTLGFGADAASRYPLLELARVPYGCGKKATHERPRDGGSFRAIVNREGTHARSAACHEESKGKIIAFGLFGALAGYYLAALMFWLTHRRENAEASGHAGARRSVVQ